MDKPPNLEAGEMFLDRSGEMANVRRFRSVVLTDQFSEVEISELAKKSASDSVAVAGIS